MPGYLSTGYLSSVSLMCAVACFASLEAVSTASWLNIMVRICMPEMVLGFASNTQTDAGDIALGSCAAFTRAVATSASGQLAIVERTVGRAFRRLAPSLCLMCARAPVCRPL